MAPAGIGDSVEGVHAVRAAIAAGRVEHLLVDRRRRDDIDELIEAQESPSRLSKTFDRMPEPKSRRGLWRDAARWQPSPSKRQSNW